MSWTSAWAWLRQIRLPWVLVVLSVLWGGYQSLRASQARQDAAQAALRATNEAASHDTTRALAAAAQKALGDSLRGVQRLIVQIEQRADQLDRALGLERIAAAGLRAKIRDLEATIAGTPVHEDSGTKVRTSSFDLYEKPYRIQATATLPPPPAKGTLLTKITLDSIRLELRLGCGKPNQDGIRPATATLSGPPWVSLGLGRVEQSPDLCESPALVRKGPSRLRWAAIGAGVSYGIQQVIRWLGGR